MRIILVRHGETEDIAAGMHQRTDTPLSPVGREQAAKVALRLSTEHIDHIYVSDYTRALETMEAIRQYHPTTPVTIDERVREVNYGVLGGQSRDSHRKLREAQGANIFDYVPQGGEAIRTVKERFIPFLESLTHTHTGTVLVVCHGYPIMFAIAHVLGIPDEKMFENNPLNTAVTIIELPEKKIHLLNDTGHL